MCICVIDNDVTSIFKVSVNCGVKVCVRNGLGGPLCQSDSFLIHTFCTAVSYVKPVLSLGFESHVGGEFSNSLGTRILASVMCFVKTKCRFGYT